MTDILSTLVRWRWLMICVLMVIGALTLEPSVVHSVGWAQVIVATGFLTIERRSHKQTIKYLRKTQNQGNHIKAQFPQWAKN